MTKTAGALALPRNLPWYSLTTGGPHLVVSNQPEKVQGTPTRAAQTLYKVEIPLEDGGLGVRVFLWHGHTRTVPQYLHLILEAVGGEIVISNHELIAMSGHLNELDEPGKCCAKGQVVPSLDNYFPGDVTLVPNQPRSVKNYPIAPPISGIENYQGAVHEFWASSQADATLRVRTALSPNTKEIGSFSDDCLATVLTHPRGYWPYSDIDVNLEEPVNVDTETSFYVAFGHENGIDSLEFARRQDDPCGFPASGNKGLYGVNATYNIALTGGIAPTIVSRKLLPGGGKYWGAMAQNPPGVPAIHRPPSGPWEHVDFGTIVVGEVSPIEAWKNAVGGAAATPVNLIYTW